MRKIEHCDGRYYNFKKGFEVCQCRDSCNHYKHYLFLAETKQPTYEMPKVRHLNIKDFRTCKRYDNPELLNKE